MKRLRVATPEEIEGFKDKADLDPSTLVLALDTQAGTAFGVIRTAIELDPVLFPDGFSDKMKAIFLRDVETFLSAKGAFSYYFNIHSDESQADWRSVVQNYGAVQVSTEPELRFKKVL